MSGTYYLCYQNTCIFAYFTLTLKLQTCHPCCAHVHHPPFTTTRARSAAQHVPPPLRRQQGAHPPVSVGHVPGAQSAAQGVPPPLRRQQGAHSPVSVGHVPGARSAAQGVPPPLLHRQQGAHSPVSVGHAGRRPERASEARERVVLRRDGHDGCVEEHVCAALALLATDALQRQL